MLKGTAQYMKPLQQKYYIRRLILTIIVLVGIAYGILAFFKTPSAIDSPSVSESIPIHTTDSTPLDTSPAPSKVNLPFNLILVNYSNKVSANFSPENLINVYERYGSSTVSLRDINVMMNEEAYLACREMFIQARQHGIKDTYLLSAYRDYNKQSELYEDYVSEGG